MAFFDFFLQDSGPVCYLSIELICLLFKIAILLIIYQRAHISISNKPLIYVTSILLTGAFTNSALIACRLGCPPFDVITPLFFKFLLRVENATLAIQLFSMVLFAEVFTTTQKKKFTSKLLLFFALFTALSILSFCLWGVHSFMMGNFKLSPIAKQLYLLWSFILLAEGFFAVYILYKNYQKEQLNLVRYHMSTLGFLYMLPYFLMKIFETDLFAPVHYFPTTSLKINFPMTTLTSVWLTIITYACGRRLMGLRFLNMRTHVAARRRKNSRFVHDFKVALGRLGSTALFSDIYPITKDFFSKAFKVKNESVTFIIRDSMLCMSNSSIDISEEQILEQAFFFDKAVTAGFDCKSIIAFLDREKIIIRDEVEFTNFYNKESNTPENLDALISFLKFLNAEVYVPIYSDGKLVASLIVEYGGRSNTLYTDADRDEMLVFANYLGSILSLFMHMNFELTLQRQRSLENEVYKKTKLVAMFRKSVYTALHEKTFGHTGVITYRNRKFMHCNQTSRDILQLDLTSGHRADIAQNITDIAQQVALSFSPKKALVLNAKNENVTLDITSNLEKNNTIITVSSSNLIDMVRDQLPLLTDESKWEYLLALKTTDEGKSISYLLPADSPLLFNIKITLLEQATIRKTILLEIPSEEDTTAFVEVIHKIKNRKIFEECVIDSKTDEAALLQRFFGINSESAAPCLLEVLHKKGTLFIRNIHLLSLEMQKKLLGFIKTGKYIPLEGNEYRESDIILIFSSDQNLAELTQMGLFLQDLFIALRSGVVGLAPLSLLPTIEFNALLEGLRRQIVSSKVYQSLLVLSERDKRKLYESKCTSLAALKSKIQHILIKKTRKKALQAPAMAFMSPSSTVSDLDLPKVARLGRTVLKDPKILALLMQKFNNRQSYVARFLSVDRSTIHRWCSKHNIESSLES